MNEKIIKINENNYLVTTGDVKKITGNITKEDMLKIYRLRDLINTIYEEIKTKKEELKQVQDKNKMQREVPKLRRFTIITSAICSIIIGIATGSIFLFAIAVIVYAGMFAWVKKFMKTIFGTKEQNELDEKNINESLEDTYQKLKEYEKELTEIIERTKYKEIDIEREKTWEDLFYTEEEIKLHMQETPAPFNPETIFGTSKEFDWTQHLGRNSVENILNDTTPFPDKVLRPVAFETPKSQSDISWVEPYLDEDIEEDETYGQGEKTSRLARRLTPSKNIENK